MGVEVMNETTRMKATTKQYARNLRHNMTDAEKLLWRHLRMGQFDGYKFRRQHPLGNYIADFVCLEAGLIIEVDGGQHMVRSDSDEVRTQWLNDKGFRVMRFWNNEVMNNIDGVKQAIMATLLPPSQPSPCNGEGAEAFKRGIQ